MTPEQWMWNPEADTLWYFHTTLFCVTFRRGASSFFIEFLSSNFMLYSFCRRIESWKVELSCYFHFPVHSLRRRSKKKNYDPRLPRWGPVNKITLKSTRKHSTSVKHSRTQRPNNKLLFFSIPPFAQNKMSPRASSIFERNCGRLDLISIRIIRVRRFNWGYLSEKFFGDANLARLFFARRTWSPKSGRAQKSIGEREENYRAQSSSCCFILSLHAVLFYSFLFYCRIYTLIRTFSRR